MVVDTDDLGILPTGEFYEVWFVADDDPPERPNRISAGTFHPDPEGVTEVVMTAAVNPELFPTLEITAEPCDDDPAVSGQPILTFDLEVVDQ